LILIDEEMALHANSVILLAAVHDFAVRSPEDRSVDCPWEIDFYRLRRNSRSWPSCSGDVSDARGENQLAHNKTAAKQVVAGCLAVG
jgi:hypothetical protein